MPENRAKPPQDDRAFSSTPKHQPGATTLRGQRTWYQMPTLKERRQNYLACFKDGSFGLGQFQSAAIAAFRVDSGFCNDLYTQMSVFPHRTVSDHPKAEGKGLINDDLSD
ncbi:hypothetical protein IQ265_10320 [Nodosilinea sp. LEGE 06152]|uniref:hypothetical protein n=1 Tax=Nodosilinea sp. LEGE 06152 TaxID=2777966 RepID=UPI0018815C65|nr:hypothetical protein [Nodosilinea sp. LEGE 06152]MBE9157216.1 hypothetical protein [Nodosilinea sp. LEGE 06152]